MHGQFSNGIINIFEKRTVQQYAGGMPKEVLAHVGWTRYGDRTISYSRLYEARGADAPCDRVLRIPPDVVVKVGQYVIPEDGEQYRVDAVSPVIVKSSFRALELTLARQETHYDLTTE